MVESRYCKVFSPISHAISLVVVNSENSLVTEALMTVTELNIVSIYSVARFESSFPARYYWLKLQAKCELFFCSYWLPSVREAKSLVCESIGSSD